MTVIVGFVDKEKRQMIMGSDTLLSGGQEAVSTSHEKIFEDGGYLIGHTGSPRAMQIVRYANKFPRYTKKYDKDPTEFVCNRIVPSLITCLIEHGYAKNEAGHIETEDIFMLMFRGHIYSIWSDFQVFEANHDFFAIGSGSQIALGSFMASEGQEPEDRVYMAVESSMEFSTNVGGECRMIKKKY